MNARAILAASGTHFIKLGTAGRWEEESLREGILRFGYAEAPHELCVRGDWEGVRQAMLGVRGNPGVATRDTNQVRTFYEADEQAIFITFVGGLLHWCRPRGPVELLADGTHRRQTVDGWRSQSLGGAVLTADRLSGHLLKVQMFRGTICDIRASEYLLRKLSDQLSPEIAAAEEAERALLTAITGLLRLLTWQDFELLVDLVFSTSGWRRVGVLGKVQKTVDLELVLPSTGERAFVQVKSHATTAALRDYVGSLETAGAYDRMFFVWHSGTVSASDIADVILIGPSKLARMVLDAGLSSWLREKVS